MADGIWGNETVSAVLGGLSGGVVSWIVTRKANKDARKLAGYQAVETILDELECSARDYWRKSGRIPVEESKIKSLLERLDLKVQAYFRIRKSASLEERAREVLDDLSEYVSGGDFETVKRRPDFGRVKLIKAKCAQMRDALHE